MTMHTKQSSAFQVLGGEVRVGVHMPFVLFELQTASGGVAYDLRRTSDELPDGWYVFCCADGVTRRPAVNVPNMPPPRRHTRPVLRVRTPIRGQHTLPTLYGQTT
jgi:hypothetical protein